MGAHTVGQMTHEIFQDALKDRIVGMEERVTFNGGKFKLVGHYDLLVEVKSERTVIDLKTTSLRRKNLPRSQHMKQLMAYQGMLGGIRGAILYINRSNWELSYLPQAFDKPAFSRIIAKLSEMALYEKRNEIPPPIPEYPEECSTEYTRCQYYQFCFPDDVD